MCARAEPAPSLRVPARGGVARGSALLAAVLIPGATLAAEKRLRWSDGSCTEARIGQISDLCLFSEVKVRALKGEPAALRRYEAALPACAGPIDTLEGKADFEEAWRALVRDSCRSNVDPRPCEARMAQDQAQPDGRERARIALIEFGWNNCANPIRARWDEAFERAAARVQAQMRQFKPRSLNCQSPRGLAPGAAAGSPSAAAERGGR